MMQGSRTVKPTTAEGVRPVDDPAARRLVQEAHGRMYRWPAGFGGYRARLSLNDEGCVYTGRVSLVPRKETTVQLDGADAAFPEWCENGSGPRGCTWLFPRSRRVTANMCCPSILTMIPLCSTHEAVGCCWWIFSLESLFLEHALGNGDVGRCRRCLRKARLC